MVHNLALFLSLHHRAWLLHGDSTTISNMLPTVHVGFSRSFYRYSVTVSYVCVWIVYWSGKNIQLSGSALIPVASPIRIVANDFFRWYGNPCTFSYSAVFWNFSRWVSSVRDVHKTIVCCMYRWEKEIDWMAMNGINLVYATTGMEYIFSKVSSERRKTCIYCVDQWCVGISSTWLPSIRVRSVFSWPGISSMVGGKWSHRLLTNKYSSWLQAPDGKSAKTRRSIVAKMASISVWTSETDRWSNVWARNYTSVACFYWIHATNCSEVSKDQRGLGFMQRFVNIVYYNYI